MNFYERYAIICGKQGLDPCSQKIADALGITRATISTWNKKNTAPKGETVAQIADTLGVSADYLLGRTDDPTDYANPELIAELSTDVLDQFNGDVRKAVNFQKSVTADALKERNQPPYIVRLYDQLDDMDRMRVEAYIEGILTGDKYKKEKHA